MQSDFEKSWKVERGKLKVERGKLKEDKMLLCQCLQTLGYGKQLNIQNSVPNSHILKFPN